MSNWKRCKLGIGKAVKYLFLVNGRFISHHSRLYLTFILLLLNVFHCVIFARSRWSFAFLLPSLPAVERTRHIDLSYLRWKLCIIWLCMIAGHKKHIIGGETISSRDSSVKLNFNERGGKSERNLYFISLWFSFRFNVWLTVVGSWDVILSEMLLLRNLPMKIEIISFEYEANLICV